MPLGLRLSTGPLSWPRPPIRGLPLDRRLLGVARYLGAGYLGAGYLDAGYLGAAPSIPLLASA